MGFNFIRMSIEELHLLFLTYPKVCTDTRKELKNSLFFCLSGENFNGNSFAAQALQNEAAYVVVDDKNYWVDDSRYIVVENALKTLQQLARFHRNQFNIPVLGITGTNGKTTTKELVTTVLSKKFKLTSTSGNFNNHLGVPLTLLQITKETEIAVIEMGANHRGEIAFLCELARPQLGILTNIGKAHLEGFGSLEAIKETKLALYKAVRLENGKVFYNADDPFLTQASTELNRISYGEKSANDIHGKTTNSFPFLEFSWGFKNTKSAFKVNTNLIGDYNLSNLMAAIAVGIHFGIEPKSICESLQDYYPQNNRSQFVQGNNNELILDAYNANPASVKAALENFKSDQQPNKSVIIGDMFELGQFSEMEHKQILDLLKSMHFSSTYLVGTRFKQWEAKYPDFVFFENTDSAQAFLTDFPLKNHRILIKGSRGVKLEVLIDCLK